MKTGLALIAGGIVGNLVTFTIADVTGNVWDMHGHLAQAGRLSLVCIVIGFAMLATSELIERI